MKKFIETIKNIFRIEELRTRIVYTVLLILVYRLGCFVVLPGIDASMLASLQARSSEGLVGLLNMFSGGALGNASIFALGVMPYISASIVIQLLGVFVPYFRKLQMEGESGRKKMNQMTRIVTIVVICKVRLIWPLSTVRSLQRHSWLCVISVGAILLSISYPSSSSWPVRCS